MNRRVFYFLGILVALSVVVFLVSLGRQPFIDYDEAAYAQILKESTTNHDLLSLRFIGEFWFEKPPLYFWLARFFQLCISSPEYALRLPSALAAIATVIVVFLIAYEVTKKAGWGFIAGLILMNTAAIVDVGRQVKLDMLLTFFIIFSFYAWVMSGKNKKWYLLWGLTVGLSVMTKSAAGLVAFLPVMVFALVERKTFWREGYFYGGLAVLLSVILPWHIYESLRFGSEFWQSYLFIQVVNRYQHNFFGQSLGLGDYFQAFYSYAMPWSLLVIISIVVWAYFFKQGDRHMRRFILTCIISALSIFALFASAQTRSAYYLIPLYPFVALALALIGKELWQYLEARIKIALVFFFAILFIDALVRSVIIGFHLTDDFNPQHAFAAEEKQIGLVIKDDTIPVYMNEPEFWETIRYYSGGRDLRRASSTPPADRPLYLVTPSTAPAIWQSVKLLTRFKGSHFILLEAQ